MPFAVVNGVGRGMGDWMYYIGVVIIKGKGQFWG